MFGELLAVLKVEFFLPALLGRARGHVALRPRVAKDGRAKLLVHQDPGVLLAYTGRNGSLEAVANSQPGGSDPRRLLGNQRTLPAEYS